MKKQLLFTITAGMLCLCATEISAETLDSIAGSWKTFDDDTNQPAAIVQISEKNGVFSGLITKLLDPSAPTTCDKCTDARKGKPVMGMEILSNLKKTGDSY